MVILKVIFSELCLIQCNGAIPKCLALNFDFPVLCEVLPHTAVAQEGEQVVHLSGHWQFNLCSFSVSWEVSSCTIGKKTLHHLCKKNSIRVHFLLFSLFCSYTHSTLDCEGVLCCKLFTPFSHLVSISQTPTHEDAHHSADLLGFTPTLRTLSLLKNILKVL